MTTQAIPSFAVIPAKAGIQTPVRTGGVSDELDSRFRGNDLSGYHYLFIFLAWICVSEIASAASGNKVVLMDNPAICHGAMAVNSAARKLYAGRGHDARQAEAAFWVYDIFTDGEVTATDERSYPIIPERSPSDPAGNFLSVCSMALSPDGRKLYIGLSGSPNDERRCLITYDLDEKGEPKGKLRAYDFGMAVESPKILVHPKLPCLYVMSSHGASGIILVPLNKGEPTGEPQKIAISKSGSLTGAVFSKDLGALIFGATQATVEVARLDPSGIPEPASSFKISESADPAWLTCLGKVFYCAINGRLWAQSVNGDGEPSGQPRSYPKWKAIDVRNAADGSLYVALGEQAGDGPPEKGKLTGTKIARFKPDQHGNPGEPVFVSEPFEGRKITNMAVDESTGAVYVTLAPL